MLSLFAHFWSQFLTNFHIWPSKLKLHITVENFFVIKKPHSQELLLNVKINQTKISSSKSKDVFFRCSSCDPQRWNVNSPVPWTKSMFNFIQQAKIIKFLKLQDRMFWISMEFFLNVFTEFSEFRDKNNSHYSKSTRTCHLLCKRPGCYHSTSETHVRDRILKLIQIHASVIYQFPWIRWIHWIQWKFRSI